MAGRKELKLDSDYSDYSSSSSSSSSAAEAAPAAAKMPFFFSFDRSFSSRYNQGPMIQNPNLARYSSMKKPATGTGTEMDMTIVGKVRRLCNAFESAKSSQKTQSKPLLESLGLARSLSNLQLGFDRSKLMRSMGFRDGGSSPTGFNDRIVVLPGTEDRIVIYFTSLRGIRRTYEDCYAVRMIFRGFRVAVDERDISMDSAYRKELQSVLGQKTVSLPQVFMRGKHVGGAEEVKQLHETGKLGKLLQGFPLRNFGSVCEVCGDARFVPCGNCNGSRKIFSEEDEQLSRCPDCNENGLLRCPECCY